MGIEFTAHGSNPTTEVANLTMEKEAMVMATAMGFGTIFITILFTKLWLVYVKPWIQCLSQERMLAKQGVPIVPGRSLFHGHGHLEKNLKEEVDKTPMNTKEPHDIYPRVQPFLHLCSKLYGNTFVYWKAGEVTLHTNDPEMIKEVLVTQAKNFQKNGAQRIVLDALLGSTGISSAEGAEWAHQRKLISPAFKYDKVKKMVEPMIVSLNNVMEKWEKSIEEGGGTAEFNVVAQLSFITGDILCRTCLGTTHEMGKQYFTKLIEMIELTSYVVRHDTMPGLSLLPTSRNRRIWQLNREMKVLVEDLVLSTRRSAAKNGGSYGDDFLGIIMEASEGEEPKYRLSNQELIDEVKIIFLAGQETTSLLLSWGIVLLGKHPKWQEKAYEEIEVETCHGQKQLDYDTIGKLRIMSMIINETLRLYPPVAAVQRESLKELQLGKITIPKGLSVFLNVLGMHHDPALWGPDVYTFNPERFADGPTKAATHPHAFMPFSIGPRYCIGQSFASLEAKLTMATIVQRFTIRISPNYVHDPVNKLGPKPKTGIQILLSKR